ncbi:MAG: hypothetical protein SOZ52_00195 [Pyramidobacter sp.]|nr:hypothetical protein [Pyramidobacter sp.]
MSYQSEAALEQQFIEQLNKQGYNPVSIPDYDALLENFKIQFAAFNAAKYNGLPSQHKNYLSYCELDETA